MKKFPQLPNIPCQKMGFFETQVVPFSHRQVWHSFRFCVSNSFGVKPVVIFRWPTRCHQKVLSSRFLQATWIQDWLFLVIIEFTEFEGDKRHSHFGWSQIQVPKYHVFSHNIGDCSHSRDTYDPVQLIMISGRGTLRGVGWPAIRWGCFMMFKGS